jgi:Zn finger protein HypA/HybF involved in hydrogenase expression
MHELSVATNLLKILEKVKEEKHASSFLCINLTVNPYSCIDEENINFIFRSMTRDNPLYKKSHIRIKRGNDPASREFILENVEIEAL